MKKKLLPILLITVLLIFLSAFLLSCNDNVDTDSPFEQEQQELDKESKENELMQKIQEVYKLYADEIISNSETPLTYSEWVASIRGEDGVSPIVSIGENGNWFINAIDTGINSKGDQGEKGEKGEQGEQGELYTVRLNFIVDNDIYKTIDISGSVAIPMPNEPIKDNYIFDGWYWDNQEWQNPLSINSLLNMPLTSNMRVYAKWTAFSCKDGHEPSEDYEIFVIKPSTCTEYGSAYYLVYCSICGDMIMKVKDSLPLANHDFSQGDHTVCSVCGYSLTQLKAPSVTIIDGVASWGKVAGAGSYSYTITDENDAEVSTGSIKSTATLQVTLEEGQSIVVKAVPKDTSKYSESEYSAKITYTKTITAVDKLICILGSCNSIIDTINSIQKDSTIGMEAIINIFFKDIQKTDNITLNVKAGLDGKSVSNSKCLLDFQVNDKSYASLGYADKKILVREPLNFVNTDDEEADAFYINVSVLQDSINALVKLALTELADISEIKYSDLINDLEPTLKSVDRIVKLDKLLSFEDIANGGTSIGLRCGALNTILCLLPTFFEGVDIDAYGRYLDKVVSFVQENIDEDMFVLKDGKTLSWNYIKTQIANKNNADNVIIRINIAQNNDDIKSIGLDFDLSALDKNNLDYAFGIEVALPTFALNKSVQIDTNDFKSKDLKLSTDVNLGVKGIDAKLDANICLSEAFAKAGNIYGYATLTATTNDGAPAATAKGYIDGNGAYVDLTAIFELFGIEGEQTKYKQLYELNGKTLDAFINEKIIGFVDGILNPANNAASVGGMITALLNGEESFFAYVYNEILPLLDEQIEPNPNAGLRDILTWIENIEFGGATVGDYLKINLVQDTWADLAEEFENVHEAGKATLAAAINIDEDNNIVGIQFSGDDSLLGYLDNFVHIPSIILDEPDFSRMCPISDTYAFIDWINWIFAPYDDTHTEAKNMVRYILDTLIGVRLDEIIENSYIEMQGYDGYHGRVAIRDSAVGATYVSIEVSISLPSGTSSVEMETKLFDIEDAIDFNSKDLEENYIIGDACKELLNAIDMYE